MKAALGVWLAAAAIVAHGLVAPGVAQPTPSTTFWAPATPSVQPHRVLHVTYDTYFGTRGAYPVDVGLEIGVLPTTRLQAEVGFDLMYPTSSSGGGLAVPLLLNAKVGSPEGAWFKGSPAWSAGIFGVGYERDVTDYHVVHVNLGRSFPRVGSFSAGAYYGLNERLLRSSAGAGRRSGLLAGWISPGIDVPVIDRIHLAWDVQTGRNVLGATGGGAYAYLTPAIDLLVGPVFFFDRELQPGSSLWMWSVQLDADIELGR